MRNECENAARNERGDALRNGTLWLDSAGVPIQAHGGWILSVGAANPDSGTEYFWYGEDKSGITVNRRMDAIGIRCYRSHDLLHWHDCGLVFRADSASEHAELRPSGVTERPRVLFCPATGRYVLWVHADDARYRSACAAVAVSDVPTGPFELVRVMRPNNQESRDFTLFADADGGYLIHSSEANKTLHIARLTPDYLDVDGSWTCAFSQQEREAPCLFAARGQYYLLTSGCTGWRPNPALFGTSPQVTGAWKLIDNPCRGPHEHTTFNGQATCVFWAGEGDDRAPYVLIDHWHPDDLGSSGYSILPIAFLPQKHDPIEIRWSDVFEGVGNARVHASARAYLDDPTCSNTHGPTN